MVGGERRATAGGDGREVGGRKVGAGIGPKQAEAGGGSRDWWRQKGNRTQAASGPAEDWTETRLEAAWLAADAQEKQM